MGHLDLDAARAARAESRGEDRTFTFGGEEFTLPPEMPFEAAEALLGQDLRKTMTALVNGQADAFFALSPSVDDLAALVEWIAAEYTGRTPGESPASRSSSPKGSRSSRPRSKPSTAST